MKVINKDEEKCEKVMCYKCGAILVVNPMRDMNTSYLKDCSLHLKSLHRTIKYEPGKPEEIMSILLSNNENVFIFNSYEKNFFISKNKISGIIINEGDTFIVDEQNRFIYE